MWGWRGGRWHLDLGLRGPGGARPGAARGWSPSVGLSFQAVLHPYALGSTAPWLALVKKHLPQPPSPDIPLPPGPHQPLPPQHVPSEASSPHTLWAAKAQRVGTDAESGTRAGSFSGPQSPVCLMGMTSGCSEEAARARDFQTAVWLTWRPGGRCHLAGALPPRSPPNSLEDLPGWQGCGWATEAQEGRTRGWSGLEWLPGGGWI